MCVTSLRLHTSSLQENTNKPPAKPNLCQQFSSSLCVLSGAALWPVVTSEGPGHNPLAWCATLSLNCSSSHVPHWTGLHWVQTMVQQLQAPLKSTAAIETEVLLIKKMDTNVFHSSHGIWRNVILIVTGQEAKLLHLIKFLKYLQEYHSDFVSLQMKKEEYITQTLE